MLDVLLHNAQIIDGTGKPGFVGDIGITGDHISEIGQFPGAAAKTTLDVSGRVVLPGFIDMHSHADLALLAAPEAESLIRQGITTIVTGQCGFSPAPLGAKYRKEMLRSLSMFLSPKIPVPWNEISTFNSFLDTLENTKPAVNVVPLVGHGMIRATVMGYRSNQPTRNQIEQMQEQILEALGSGAFGVSTGLIYPPGTFTTTAEIIETLKPLGDHGGLYFSHARGEAGSVLGAYAEAIEIGRALGTGVQISHFKAAGRQNWDKAATALALVDQARLDGYDVTADMYPYEAGWTYLATLLPKWALAGSQLEISSRLLLPWQRKKIIAAMKAGEGESIDHIEWDKIYIAGSSIEAYSGHSIAELADQEEADPFSWLLNTLLKTRGSIQMIIMVASEANIRTQLIHPALMIGTDGMGMSTSGMMRQGIPHPRSFGTYPRLFGQFVRTEGLLSLEEASWKSSGFPAQKLGLKDRGIIQKGYKADLVVLDPKTIRDCSTYAQPLQYPQGIDLVFVNGEIVLRDGQQNKVRSGQVIRRG